VSETAEIAGKLPGLPAGSSSPDFRGYTSRRVQPRGRSPWPDRLSRGGPKPREVIAWLRDWLPADHFRVIAWYQQVIEELYGPKAPTQAVVSIAKGNGKTTFAAGLGVFELMGRGELQPQVLNIATTSLQARIVYEQAVQMIEAVPELRSRALSRWVAGYTRIEVPQLGGMMQPLPTRDARSLQGYTPSFAVVDEIGFVNEASWSAMAQAVVKRRRALVLGIGTPGYDEGLMWRLRTLARENPHPALLYREYAPAEGAAIDDEREWRRANPGIASGVKSISAMRGVLHTSSESEFRTLQLGQWTKSESKWLPPGSWAGLEKCEPPGDGAEVALGFDGSSSDDSTALCWATANMVGLVELWERPGKAGWQVPRHAVIERIRECFKRWHVRVLAADPYGWQTDLEELSREFGERRVVQYPTNSYRRFAPACDRFFTAVKTEDLRHDHAPGLARHIANAVPRRGPHGTAIDKAYARAEQKVDAAVAAVVAHEFARSLQVGEPRRAQFV
jgi:phage terminase large subunit-like protein